VDNLFEVAAFLFYAWRVAVGAAAGAVVAFALKAIFPALPAGALFTLVFAATSIGVVWNVAVLSARDAAAGRPQPQISWPVAFLGFALVGGIWGGLTEATLGVTAALAATVIGPWLLGPIFAAISKQPLRVGSVALAMVAAVLGFATPHAISALFQLAEA
jgi:hypothetical protein